MRKYPRSQHLHERQRQRKDYGRENLKKRPRRQKYYLRRWELIPVCVHVRVCMCMCACACVCVNHTVVFIGAIDNSMPF